MAWFRRSKSEENKPQTAAEKRALKEERRKLVLMPPEGVPLTLIPAGLGGRLGAQLLDLFFSLLIVLALIFAALYAFQGLRATSAIIIVLAFFLLRIPYYIVSEIVMNGQTPAKRLLGLRTISVNGKGLTIYQIVVRNLLREIEFFSPVTYILSGASGPGFFSVIAVLWTIIVVVVPVRNRWNQRLGDIVADTAVINTPKPTLLPDVAIARPAIDARSLDDPFERWKAKNAETTAKPVYTFGRDQLDHYGRHELHVLERVLRLQAKGSEKQRGDRDKELTRIALQISTKIKFTESVPAAQSLEFLSAFYRAQRAYLEERNLMGDRRENKYYR